MKRFFMPENGLIAGDEAYHAARVLRCQPGEQVETIDGKGRLYSALIESVTKDQLRLCEVQLVQEVFEDPNKLAVAIAPTKNPARFEWFVEKAAEAGVAEIFPVITQRTEKSNLKTERLQNILRSAVKQSKQLFIPSLHPIRPLENIFSDTPMRTFSNAFIAHCGTERPPFLGHVYPRNTGALILIGPEGDFTPEEVAMALNNNYQAVSLGNSILRVETAGIAACIIVNAINMER